MQFLITYRKSHIITDVSKLDENQRKIYGNFEVIKIAKMCPNLQVFHR